MSWLSTSLTLLLAAATAANDFADGDAAPGTLDLDLEAAERLASLPLACHDQVGQASAPAQLA